MEVESVMPPISPMGLLQQLVDLESISILNNMGYLVEMSKAFPVPGDTD